MLKKHVITGIVIAGSALALAACGDGISKAQTESPANPYKDYRDNGTAVLGVGEPMTAKRMKANATIRLEGVYTLDDIMSRMANVYNLAVRYGDGVRKGKREQLVMAELTFDEARAYLEDVYGIQILREGERRVLVLPSSAQKRIKEFAPGVNVTLAQVVRGLAEECGINVVISENKRKLSNTYVTTTLRDVSCLDAFDAVLAPSGLSLIDRGGFYSIGGFPTREWRLNLLEPVREEVRRVTYASESSSGSSSGGSSSGSGSSSAGSGSSGNGGNNVSGGSAEVTISENRNFWNDLQANLRDLIDKSCDLSESVMSFTNPQGGSGMLAPPGMESSSLMQPDPFLQGGSSQLTTSESNDLEDSGSFACGYVRVNKNVGLVQMRAPQSVIEQADQIIRAAEDVASRRLLVEARVLAVTRSRGYEQGGLLRAGSKIMSGRTAHIGFNPTINSYDFSVTGKIASLIGETGGGLLATHGNSMDAAVRLVESFGTTYQLMRPTIEVMDRQTATLIDGRNERYFVREGEIEVTDVGTIRNITATERTQFVGLQFNVSAQVADPGDLHTVSLQIPMTEISRYESLTQTFDGEEITDQIPVATTRVIDQKVRIRDGEIKVIGGLTRTIAIDRESGVPLIKGIPLAGKLFNEEDIEYEDVEFLVLLQVRRL